MPFTDSFTSWPTTAARNDFTGAVGFSFTLSGALALTAVGRLYVAGNTQDHLVKIWRTSDQVLMGSATILAATASDGNNFKFANLPLTLQGGTQYAVACDDTNGGDKFKDQWAASLDALITAFTAVYTTTPGAFPNNNSSANNMFDTIDLRGSPTTAVGTGFTVPAVETYAVQGQLISTLNPRYSINTDPMGANNSGGGSSSTVGQIYPTGRQ
jgi:hypothetical protein